MTLTQCARATHSPLSARAVGLVVGVVMDRLFADPRTAWHPVAWFGTYSSAVERRLWRDDKGAGVANVAIALAPPLLLSMLAQRATRGGWWRHMAATATACWLTSAAQGLGDAAQTIHAHLERGELDKARGHLSYLCARNPEGLDEAELARATVESVAENTSDGAVAPIFWGAFAGIPGFVVYRAINTLDSMVGYRSDRYRNFGWAAAQLDDVANYVPARFTAAVAAASATSVGGSPHEAWQVWRADGHRHPSPNAGHPESAFAGALGVRLGGTNTYVGEGQESRPSLGTGPAAHVADIPRATALLHTVVRRSTGVLMVITIMRALLRRR